MGDMMDFPASVEEFMEQYKMTDTEHVYSNGTEYVPIYRMKQWFEHYRNQQRPTVDAVPVVRCRECKYWGDEDGKLQDSDGVLFARCKVNNYLIDGRHTGWCPTENDFCSYGERRGGGEDG